MERGSKITLRAWQCVFLSELVVVRTHGPGRIARDIPHFWRFVDRALRVSAHLVLEHPPLRLSN